MVVGCALTELLDVDELIGRARHVLHVAEGLVAAEHLYPYYHRIVRQGTCEDLIGAIGWIVISQLVVGLICFPASVLLTHSFLVRWGIWEWAKEHTPHAKEKEAEKAARLLEDGDADGEDASAGLLADCDGCSTTCYPETDPNEQKFCTVDAVDEEEYEGDDGHREDVLPPLIPGYTVVGGVAVAVDQSPRDTNGNGPNMSPRKEGTDGLESFNDFTQSMRNNRAGSMSPRALVMGPG